ncbi:DUF4184 family protein [Kineococcus sp. SYSU DK004]|uniref:DUF4184 family protein n=1 Tax=Kineococcus sp. SYSU DK004 TaxID=3383125 RepID=UPI003D7E5150
MPVTPAHPAAVLPLLRGPLVPAALVAGAVAPDVPYSLRATGVPVSAQSWYEPFVNATTSHSVAGALPVALPLALALLALWLAARRPLAALLPVRGTQPVAVRTWWARAGWVLVSALVGIATHLVWDGLTHGDGWLARRLPLLGEPALAGLTWGRVWEHLNSVGGLLVLAVFAHRHRARVLAAPGGAARRRAGAALVLAAGAALAGAALAARRWWGAADVSGLHLVEGVVSDAVKGAGAALGLAALVAVAAWWGHRAATAPHRVARVHPRGGR